MLNSELAALPGAALGALLRRTFDVRLNGGVEPRALAILVAGLLRAVAVDGGSSLATIRLGIAIPGAFRRP